MTATQTTGKQKLAVSPRRFRGVLPEWIAAYRQPRWWQEVALVAFGYWLYDLGRNTIPRQDDIALSHGRSVQRLQDSLHLNFELSLNRWVAAHDAVAQVMNYYYATLHFIVTIGVMVWLFVYHKQVFRGARTVVFATTMFALAGFYLYPLAPPRLLPQFGYVDTLLKFHTWGSLADPKIADHSNQYAAMPSLHIAWALWAGMSLFFCARRVWVRALGVVYPACTFVVIIGTANHFIIDAVGGVAIVLAGLAVQYLLFGRWAYSPAELPSTSSAE